MGVKMSNVNKMKIEFDSRSCNEGFARVAVAAFLTQLDPTLEEVSDVKTAVSEAVTNCIIHGYENEVHKIILDCKIEGNEIEIVIKDTGKGIENIEQAMEPLFTTKPELDRSGMGFAFMEAFMDQVKVTSKMGEGTSIYMKKIIGMDSTLTETGKEE